MGIKAGWQFKLYRNTGSYGSPSWNEVDDIADLTFNMAGDEDDVTLRRHGGYKATELALKDWNASFTMLRDTADADWDAFADAYHANTSLDIAVVDGDIGTSGTRGGRFVVKVMTFEENQDVGKFARTSVTIKPCYISDSTQAPVEWITA